MAGPWYHQKIERKSRQPQRKKDQSGHAEEKKLLSVLLPSAGKGETGWRRQIFRFLTGGGNGFEEYRARPVGGGGCGAGGGGGKGGEE